MSLRDEYGYDQMLATHILEQVLDTPKFKAFYLKEPGMGRMQSCLILFSPEGINILGDLCPGNDTRNSGVHAYGYGLDWFAGRLSWSYLCEKFLSKDWHKEVAIEDCRHRADEIMRGETSYFNHDRELEDLLGERETLAHELSGCLDDRRNPTEHTPPKDEILRMIAKIRAEGTALKKRIMEKRTEHARKYLDLADELESGEMGIESFGAAMSEIDRDFYECSPGYGYHPRSRCLLIAIQKKFSELYHAMKESCPVGSA
jgi:hypothetical protein